MLIFVIKMSMLNKSLFKFSLSFILILNLFRVTAQNNTFEEEFQSLDLSEKVVFYDTLNDSVRNVNSVFLKANFEKNYRDIHDSFLSKKVMLAIAQLNYHTGDYIQSVNVLKSILEDKRNKPTAKDSMSVYDELKKSYYKLYLYSEIFEVNSKIDELISNGVDYPLWSYNMNSKLYGRLEQYDKAIVALKKEIKELQAYNKEDNLIIPSGYNDLGYYYYKSKKMDSALVNYKKSISYADSTLRYSNKVDYDRLMAVVKGNIAAVYVIKEQYNEAIPLLLEEIGIEAKDKSGLIDNLHSYNLLARCYIKLKRYDEAIQVLSKIKLLLQTKVNDRLQVDYLRNMADFFYQQKENDSSFYYLNEVLKIKDSIDAQGKSQILASNELIYNITEEQRIFEKHKSDLKNQELRLKNKAQNTIISFTVLLFFLLLYSLYNIIKLKKSKKEIKEKNEEVEQALSEKEVLLKEVHHRVKNNLQVISGLLELQNIKVTDENVKIALNEGQNRIQTVALVHKLMYQSESVSKVNMQHYLEELVQVLQLSYAKQDQQINTKIEALGVDIDITLAVPISLIVNEAVCNIYKHAFKDKESGNIYVGITKVNETTYSLIIKDDGIGMPENIDIKKLKSIGFDLINGLSRQIKGGLKVKNVGGTEISILFSNGK